MTSSYYSRRSRYGSTSYNDRGYMSDGGHTRGTDARLNKSRSLEDLTSTRAQASSSSFISTRLAAGAAESEVHGSRGHGSTRYTSDFDRPNFSHGLARDGRRGYGSSAYGSRDELIGRHEGHRHGGRDGVIGTTRNIESYRLSGSKELDDHRARDSSTKVGGILRGGVAGHSDLHDSASKVKYRISGEIVRTDSPDDRLKGYSSDTGLIGRSRLADNAGGYSSDTTRHAKDRISRLTLPSRRESGQRWSSEVRSRSVERSRFGTDVGEDPDRGRNAGSIDGGRHRSPERDYPTRGRDLGGVPGRGAGRRSPSADDQMVDRGGPYRPRSRSASPMTRSGLGPSARMGSPSRRPRKATSMSNLLGGRSPARGGRDSAADDPSSFPVCSRWPNCTVCSIDIPSSMVNKDTIMRTMKAELKEEVENIALLEKKEKTIQEKAQSNAYLTQELQRCQKELESRNSEISRKDYEINQLKTEVKNLHIAKKHIEQSFTEVQVQVNQTEVVEKKLMEVQEQHDNVLLKNRELIDRIKHLEIAEKEFIELERNVIELQEQLRDMENIEAHRDELYDKFQHLKRQRDDFMEKGRMVEEERNDFLRTNQTMEQRLEEFKKKYILSKKTTGELNRKILILEREKKELESKILDVQNDRNIMQTALGKLEVERDDLIREVKEVTSERYILEQKLAEMDDMLSDHDHLEEGFHSLRLKLAEITRQRDDAEMLIPSLKAKIALLKKACREKDETVTRYVEELKHVKHDIGTSGTAPKGRHYEPSQPNSRNRRTSSYFTENKREERYHSKPRKPEYEISEESVLLSEDDQTITEDGSIMLDNRSHADRRSHTTNRTVHVYDHRSRPSGRTKTFRALYDYDPYKSSSSVHPERELRLKEGDYVTVYGEMDIDGYLEAEVDGETGLIPSIYVEESNDDDTRRSREITTREVTTRNGYGVRQRKFVAIYDYDPYTMGRTGRPEQQLSLRKGDVITVIGDIDIDGYYSAEINGRNGLVPSTFVRELGASATSGASSYGAQKTYETHTTRTSEHRSSNAGMRGGSVEIIRDDVVGPPFAPSNLKILRIVSKDSVLLTWNMPPIDKFGKSNGAVVTGYKIWVNGKPKQEVKKYLMTKALVSGLNLHDHLEFDIQTVAENGFCSEKCHFNITGAHALRNPVYEEFFMKAVGNYRTFIALFDYDPYKSSPNQNPALELQFNEGDLLKIYDTSRTDGFYQAEVRGKKGLVPSNFIEEISMPENSYSHSSDMYTSRSGGESYSRTAQSSSTSYGQTTSSQQQQQQRSMTSSGLTTSEYEKRSSLSTNGGRKRKMVAVYDYDPLKQSPSKDKSKELNLRKGQYVTVVGDMRPDGFYLGEIDGRQGLVPGDFLEPSKDDDSDSRRVQFASGNDGNP